MCFTYNILDQSYLNYLKKKMEKSKVLIRHCLLYEYQMSHSAREATRNLCIVIGQGSVSHATASQWFLRFDEKDVNLSDEAHI